MFTASLAKEEIGSLPFRKRVFAGAIFKLRGQSEHPVRVASQWLHEHFGDTPDALGDAWSACSWSQVSAVQQAFCQAPVVQAAVRDFIRGLHMPFPVHMGAARLRVVVPGADKIAEAAPAYLPHRDTWFANSQAQINWWMPLSAVDSSTSFGFCPELFDVPVANSSADFDYRDWQRGGGFQGVSEAGGAGRARHYPSTEGPVSPQRFQCDLGDTLCFSASHLHQTLPVARARLSLDFRTIAQSDLDAGLGAPNVDNRSIGDARVDYGVCSSRPE